MSDPISSKPPIRLVAGRPAHRVRDPALAAILEEMDRLTGWESRPRGVPRAGLDSVRDLSERLGFPELHFRSIHVAGTKGKSSTAALLEACLVEAGLKVGRYSSPHVNHIGERIALDGAPVAEPVLADALGRALTVLHTARRAGTAGGDATWFDLMTVAAFDLFRRHGVEWAVVEAGLGGRFDSTNSVDSDVALITNVELEHTEVLGGTRAAIAFEKAGIVKPGSVAVTPLGELDEAGAVIAARARAMGATLAVPAIAADATLAERNATLAGAALDALGERGVWEKTNAPYHRRLGAWLVERLPAGAARLPGRMERRRARAGGRTVAVVIDGAHIPFNLAAVLEDLRRDPALAGPFVAVVSLGRDKDAEGFLRLLQQRDARVILTCATARARPLAELSAIAAALGLAHGLEEDPLVAYKNALDAAATQGRWVLVTGSLHLAGLMPG